MSLSPWLLVGSALILGLAIAFWAVKNARQERETMSRALLERAGALMWAMEGGARAGMGMQRTAYYLQNMLEETARQPGIAYLAVITRQGSIVAHSNPDLIGQSLYSPEVMAGMVPYQQINWRVRSGPKGVRTFEAYRLFSPLQGFQEHMGHGHAMRMRGMMSGRMRGEALPSLPGGAPEGLPPDADTPQAEGGHRRAMRNPAEPGNELVMVVGLDMSAFDNTLHAAERNTLFTALLVGLIGVGGFISLFWAQSYRLSRRLLLDTTAFAAEVINSLPLGLVIFDASGRVSQVNGVAETLLNRTGRNMIGLTPGELQGDAWKEAAERVRRGESVLEEESDLQCGLGAEEATIPVSLSASRIMNERGESLGMIFLLRDLREVKRLQAELRRSERLSTLGNMAARVAHEIRNPLSSIKGFATYLGSRQDNEGDKEAARTMIGEVERLNRVVSELLDFARPSNLNLADADLGEIMNRAMRLASADAEAKGVALRLEAAGAPITPVVASVDAERLTQAVLNLVLNAVQASSAGAEVTLAVQQPEASHAVLTVTDAGHGIPPEMVSQVFSPYFTTRATGTGLGLAIVSKIVEDHYGDIAISSEPGNGTTVRIRLPLAGAENIAAGDSHA